MNPRTKFLVAAMAVVGCGVLGDQGYRRFIEEPAAKNERELGRLDKQIEAAEDTIFQSANVADQLVALEQYSLPYDSELARARYQDWLLSLVEDLDLQQPSVDAGIPVPVTITDRNTRKPREVYTRYSFSVRGRGTLDQVTRLLFRFYERGHLHKIRSLSLTPVGGGKQLDVNMGIEALGLARCERESELSTVAPDRLEFSRWESYRPIVRRNIFSGDGDASLKQILLSAVTFDRSGRPQAWFSMPSGQPTQVILPGESLEIPSHQVEVIDIQSKVVLIDLDGEVLRLPLGKSIHEMTAAASTASTASTASEASTVQVK